MEIIISAMRREDYDQVRRIFQEGMHTRQATFETSAPSWEEWDNRHLQVCRLAARHAEANPVLGWAALTPYSHRAVYEGVAEVSIYVGQSSRGKGVGTALLTRLVSDSEEAGIWTLQAGIFPENKASVTLHLACGFQVVGRRERIGCMDETWRDVLLLERRSQRVG